MKKITVFAASALCLAAACGGSSGGSDSDDEVVTFSTLDAAADDLISAYILDSGLPVAGLSRTDDLSALMGMGTVTYEGAFRAAIDGDRVLGDITLTAEIASGDVTGTGSNFQHEVDGDYSGKLTGTGLINAAPGPGIPQVALVLNGTLTGAGEAKASAIALDGDFYANGGDSVGAIAGPAEGNIGDDFITDGVFAVER